DTLSSFFDEVLTEAAKSPEPRRRRRVRTDPDAPTDAETGPDPVVEPPD
ncbi:MAG: hypothetical protein JWP74_1548, partial [Marmoricola sp.]|nr:hypothetical protein [Marmoricola sp.]